MLGKGASTARAPQPPSGRPCPRGRVAARRTPGLLRSHCSRRKPISQEIAKTSPTRSSRRVQIAASALNSSIVLLTYVLPRRKKILERIQRLAYRITAEWREGERAENPGDVTFESFRRRVFLCIGTAVLHWESQLENSHRDLKNTRYLKYLRSHPIPTYHSKIFDYARIILCGIPRRKRTCNSMSIY